MPTIQVHLPPELHAELDLEVARLRLRAPRARVTAGSLLAHLAREHLMHRRRARLAALLAELRRHPVRQGAGLPVELQDAALQAIAGGAKHLIGELVRAGEWERQIAALARRWQQDGLTHDELCAAGMVGLLQAVNRYEPGGGWRSYAYLWIKKELERACRTGGALVMESEQEMRLRRTVERALRKGMVPADIAEKTGLTPVQVERGLQGRRAFDWKELDGRKM